MGKPTIYKPSVYNGNGVYNNGAAAAARSVQYEQIKDNYYAFSQYGNKYYTLQNLRELFSGVNPFNSGNPGAAHYTEYHNENIFGYFYSQQAVRIMHNWFENNSDWHIMTKDEAEYLINHFQKNEIIDLATWKELNPINSSLLSIPSNGFCDAGNFYEQFESSYIITDTVEENKNYYLQINPIRYQCVNTYGRDNNSWPVRLCKDVL